MAGLKDNIPEPDDDIADVNYYTLQETHITYLKNYPGSKTVAVEGQIADKFAGDFHGLLDFLRIDKKYHYLIMRVNDLYSSADYSGEVTEVFVPPIGVINQLFTIFGSIER